MDENGTTAKIRMLEIMEHQGKSTAEIRDESGVAYNTILNYRRDSTDRLSRRVLEDIAESLGVEVWELFYMGEFKKPLMKIAKALEVEVADQPVIMGEYVDLLKSIGNALGIRLTATDFKP